MYFSLSQLLFNSLHNARDLFSLIFASIFWRSVSMHLLLTTFHTLLLNAEIQRYTFYVECCLSLSLFTFYKS
jgi:hypothetical protein